MRKRIWISLLLAGVLGISGNAAVWAHEGAEAGDVRSEGLGADQEVLSENMADDPGGLGDSGEGEDAIVQEPEEEGQPDGVVSADAVPGSEEPDESDVVSEDTAPGTEKDVTVSDDSVSADAVELEEGTVSDDKAVEEETDKKPMEVILPADVSFEMTPVGEQKLEGMISSRQFCIENQGDEDVRITIQGICRGESGEGYAMAGFSTADMYVPGKKNIWMYLRWEDENGEVLDQPGILIGDDLAPGVGELILKAPQKDEKGSKAYFSLTGDMRSDTDERWSDNELRLELGVSMENCENLDKKD